MINGHKVFSAAPNGNTAADMSDANYFNLVIKKLNEESERLKTAPDSSGIQILLAHLDILLYLAEKFLTGARLSVKKKDAADWETSFNAWWQRCHKKVPAKFRADIRASADDMFLRLKDVAR